MGSADRILTGFGAAAIAVALTGCGHQPGHARLRADAARLHPDCTLIDAGPGEGDSDTVYMHLRLDCTEAPQERRLVFGYSRHASGWHLFLDDRDERSLRAATGGRAGRWNTVP